MPRDIQLLSATRYGYEDILNGGFHQFFGNPGGVFAPEMAEWFARAGLPEGAELLRKAMSLLQPQYSRSYEQRNQSLEVYEQQHPADWNPFCELDREFYAVISRNRFHEAADKWMRDVCGITSLAQSYDASR